MDRYRILLLAGLLGWLTSLALPTLSFRFDGDADQVLFGYQILLIGYLHLIVLELSWLANFGLLFVAWNLWFRPERLQPLLIGALITFFLTAASARIFIDSDFFQYPRAFVGYYVWAVSIALVCAAAFAQAFSVQGKLPDAKS